MGPARFKNVEMNKCIVADRQRRIGVAVMHSAAISGKMIDFIDIVRRSEAVLVAAQIGLQRFVGKRSYNRMMP